jgi:hypothetical protein
LGQLQKWAKYEKNEPQIALKESQAEEVLYNPVNIPWISEITEITSLELFQKALDIFPGKPSIYQILVCVPTSPGIRLLILVLSQNQYTT